MNRSLRAAFGGAVFAIAAAGVAFAHHNPMDGFDANAPVVVTGEIVLSGDCKALQQDSRIRAAYLGEDVHA